MQYVELHARSAFSFLKGGSLPEALAITAAGLNLPGMALLDCNGFYGSARFHMAAKNTGIRAHVGTELSVTDKLRIANYPLLCESQTGYQNLCRLITRTKLRVPKHTDTSAAFDELEEHAGGLICLTGDEHGPLADALRNGGIEAGRKLLNRLKGMFGAGNVYVELQRHFQREQEQRNQCAIQVARELNLPVLATNGVSYATPGECEILDVFTCIKNKRQLATGGRLLCQNSERHIRTPEQMAHLFADTPEAISNTVELSSRLQFTLKDLGYKFPSYPVPLGETMDSFLYARTWEGARHRYQPVTDRATSQLDRELKLIEKLGLAGYFLIVWDIVRYCNQNGILVQGRGSAANSAVCYSLGVTAVDPIGMDLLFERFLSEERGEWPDIDLDLPSGDDREKAIQYVYQRYGQLGAAMTANICTYRGRSAARDVGKVFGFDSETLNKLSALVGNFEWHGPNDTFDRHITTAGLDLTDKGIAKYLDLCLRLQDIPRHLSQHSGGMVICQGQLDSVVPLEPATMPGRVVVQWDKDDCADLGIVKVDLLGLGMMAVLKDSINLIRDHYHEEIDLAHLPADSPDIYGVIREADTIGMFQIESRAQMASLPRNNPEKFYDLVTQVALIRPGPITGAMTAPYLKRRQKKELVTYPHPSLEPVLKRTLGVPLFQEQLLRMSMICANFTGGEAEELRRALGHKRSKKRMMEIEVRLRDGMTKNGITPKAQDEIVQFITSFALYGFPESHSASFALIAYASAFLKVRYLAAFTAALLNNQPMGFYSPATLVKDAQRHGLKIKPIDVTCSNWDCLPEKLNGKIVMRLGLRYVRGLQQIAGEALVQTRKRRQFGSIEELALRVPELSRGNMRMLAQIGALNAIGGIGLHRRDALWQVEKACQRVGSLLEGITENDTASPLTQMDKEERLVSDYHGTGLTTGPHPMFYRRAEMRSLNIKSAAELRAMPNGESAIVAGAVITRQRPGTASGLIFLTMEDETGYANVIVMPHIYEKYRQAVLEPRFVRVSGRVQNQDGIVHLKAEHVEALVVSAAQLASHDFH
ncbi:MAG TPA: error-prone DNA polymerase [Candidatus Angelobacter sp.]|nr:error-prone DNA polymerase [Candidatus Angelobacter sp.]